MFFFTKKNKEKNKSDPSQDTPFNSLLESYKNQDFQNSTTLEHKISENFVNGFLKIISNSTDIMSNQDKESLDSIKKIATKIFHNQMEYNREENIYLVQALHDCFMSNENKFLSMVAENMLDDSASNNKITNMLLVAAIKDIASSDTKIEEKEKKFVDITSYAKDLVTAINNAFKDSNANHLAQIAITFIDKKMPDIDQKYKDEILQNIQDKISEILRQTPSRNQFDLKIVQYLSTIITADVILPNSVAKTASNKKKP